MAGAGTSARPEKLDSSGTTVSCQTDGRCPQMTAHKVRVLSALDIHTKMAVELSHSCKSVRLICWLLFLAFLMRECPRSAFCCNQAPVQHLTGVVCNLLPRTVMQTSA
jgi:hypothetical protein